jgi:hypothetical protein
VPDLHVADVRTPALPGVTPRSVHLEVADERVPLPEKSKETVERVRAAVSGALGENGIAVAVDSPNRLKMTLHVPKEGEGDIDRDDCVQLVTRLDMPSAFAEASAVGCFEWRHWLGFSLGGDSTMEFKVAINQSLQTLDDQLERLEPATVAAAPPPSLRGRSDRRSR